MNKTEYNDILVNNIMLSMRGKISDEQLESLKMVLYMNVSQYDIVSKQQLPEAKNRDWEVVFRSYINSKIVSGKSDSTINQYTYHLIKLLSFINKSIGEITPSDIYSYFNTYKTLSHQYGHNIGKRSMNNMRLVFNAFFNWCIKNNVISVSPMASFDVIKYRSEIKEPFTDEERELLFYHAKTKRDKALIEYLYSTGARVSELINTNRTDINLSKKEVKICGKGDKERVTYLNSKSIVYLRKYLQSRDDNNPALFVSLYKPHNRLSIAGVESVLKKIGKSAGVENVHPHRFRRTTATNALENGMELLYVADMLGHENINTTTIYTKINRDKVKAAHQKYLHS